MTVDTASITVIDAEGKIYASSDPARFPMLAPATQVLGAAADKLLPSGDEKSPRIVEDTAGKVILVAVPIVADDGARLGSVVLSYSQDVFLPRFLTTVERVVLSTLIALVVLVPIGWQFGRRMAAPLVGLAGAMTRVGEAPPTELARGLYRSGDEIGQLGTRFEQMLVELEGKQRLEREIVTADRLAAIGRLTAGIAHEINNPLAGMLTAIDTARKHGEPDPISASTLSLVERGTATDSAFGQRTTGRSALRGARPDSAGRRRRAYVAGTGSRDAPADIAVGQPPGWRGAAAFDARFARF